MNLAGLSIVLGLIGLALATLPIGLLILAGLIALYRVG